MRGVWKTLLALVLVAVLTTGLVSCGGGGSDDSSGGLGAPTARETPGSTTPEESGPNQGGQGSGGGSAEEPSAEFRTPGGDNSIQSYGEEADPSERQQAAAALSGYMRARAEGDWAAQCDYLADVAVRPLEQLTAQSPRLKGKGCAAILAALSGGTPLASRANTMTDGIASLRVEGDRAFALYHGTEGVDYFIPMAEDGGRWKVAALAPSEFP